MNVRPTSLFRARRRQRQGQAHRAALPAEHQDATPDIEDLAPSAEELGRLQENLPRLDAHSAAFLRKAGPDATYVLLAVLLARSRGIERIAADLDADYVVNLDALPPALVGIWERRDP
jgi:hypothetical protein